MSRTCVATLGTPACESGSSRSRPRRHAPRRPGAQPAAVPQEMVRLAWSGRWVAGLEPDTEVVDRWPSDAAFDRVARDLHRGVLDETVPTRTSAAGIGSAVNRQAGTEDETVQVWLGDNPAGHSRRTLSGLTCNAACADRPLKMGRADQQAGEELNCSARASTLEDPDALAMPWPATLLARGPQPASV